MSGTHIFELEELGLSMNAYLKVEVGYDADGGSPGSYWEPPEPPSFEITHVNVLEYSNETESVKRCDRENWFDWLDEIAWRIIESDDRYETEICESHEHEYYDEY